MARIELRGVQKRFGAVEILKGIDHVVADGEFLVILGPSGCGKSTLLRMIAGLESVSDGEILADGQVINDQPPHRRDMAMVFQNYALYPHLTVYENLAYGLRIRKTPRDELARRVEAAARLLQIDHLVGRMPAQLSGGQRQRVAMGRAIVREPRAFLFDEPLSNLDAKLRNEMRLEIRRVHDRVGGTSIFVTHDQTEAMTMADTIVIMDAGRIVQSGSPIDIYNKPRNRFVAGFVGSPPMNLIRAHVAADGRSAQFGRGVIRLARALRPDDAVDIGFRPERAKLAADGEVPFDLDVEFAELLGSDTVVHGQVGGERAIIRSPEQLSIPAGTRMQASLLRSDIHVFSAADGEAIR